MKIKLGYNIADARGKLNGHVFSKNRYGNYVRNKVTPVNPQTAAQQGIRNRLSGLSSAWAALTAAQRTAWNAAVNSFAKTNIFGDLINPTGFQLHQTLNNNLLITGTAAITAPPVPAAVDAFTSISLAIAAGAATAVLTYAPAIAADHKVKVYATPGVSAGISFVKSEYRLIDVIATADASPLDVKAAYLATFGALPAAGLKVFLKVVQVNTVTGQAGTILSCSTIVAA
jgi:hypothetical protein